MRRLTVALGLAVLAATGLVRAQADKAKGVALDTLSWAEAEPVLTPSAVVVIPLGAAATEHGLHLVLGTDERLARYLASRVERAASVVIAPPLTYHYYPAFSEYPGSTTLPLPVARDMTAEVIRSLARYGPRRFYVLNTGISTARVLDETARLLADEGIAVRYTDMDQKMAAARTAQRQPGGSHADEIETSMMLYVDPASVDMGKAVRDYNPSATGGRLTRTQGVRGTYSPTGAYGDPTLATAAKGKAITEALVAGILDDIEQLRAAPLPAARVAGGTAASGPRGGAGAQPAQPNGCTPGDERTIRNTAAIFETAWRNMDAEGIKLMFTENGDMRHPDGMIERGREVIYARRLDLFRQREYRGTVHPMTVTDMRCLDGRTALADGKWELRGIVGENGARTSYAGLFTLILQRAGAGWLIEAWRYTINPPNATAGPTILKKPGWPGIDK